MLSDNSIKKILKKTGALRISNSAIKKLKIVIENYISIIAKKAIKNAEYSGRKTLKEEDIQQALEKMQKEEDWEI